MGVGCSKSSGDVPSAAELDDYEDLTYLTRPEIISAFRKFRGLSPKAVSENRHVRLGLDKILALPELASNPFADRICKVFSPAEDGSCCFEDLLDVLSALSEHAPAALKTDYMFRVYDCDQDNMLGHGDLTELIARLTGPHTLSQLQINHIIDGVFADADLDNDGMLSFVEFQYCLSQCPDFVRSFTVRLS